ncbi:MAG: hypothetical protein M3418_01565 [Gemmatimonadota bacterium]|nr:hypothetical protein [Gemmatimonadota bacterium]
MAPGEGEIPLSRLRTAVHARVRETSRRQTARELGYSPMGLQGFLDGGEPYSGARARMEAWYRKRYPDGDSGLTAAERAVEALIERLPAEAQEEARAEIVACVERIHGRLGIRSPFPPLSEAGQNRTG